MNRHGSATSALHTALLYWKQFFTQCIVKRLDTPKFEEFVTLVYSKYPLPPVVIADLFLKPQLNNHYNLDPRIPPYIQVLFRLGYIDTPSILKALYKYSSSHAQSQTQPTGIEGQDGAEPAKKTLRWGNSYWVEEFMFYSLTKSVVEDNAISDSGIAFEVVKSISKWMTLFTAAATAFAADMLGQLQASQSRVNEMESARAAFVALLLRLCENEVLVKAVSKPFAKGMSCMGSPNLCPRLNIHLFYRRPERSVGKLGELCAHSATCSSSNREAGAFPQRDTWESGSCG